MNTRRAVSVALAVTAASMLVTGSLGFSSVSAERGVQVNVVDAEDAYVGVVACEKASSNNEGNGSNPVRVWVSNQYSEQFEVVAVTSDTGDSVAGQVPQSIGTGNSHPFDSLQANHEVTVRVTGGLEASVTVDVYSKSNCPRSVSESQGGGQGEGQGASSNGSPSTTTTTTTAATEATTATTTAAPETTTTTS